MRDDKGRLILDGYPKLDDYIIGRKKKIWLSHDGHKYLFKGGSSNYEIYAELIACELAKQCGFSTAFYDLAFLDGESGVLTPSFLKLGDIIIGGEQYLSNARVIARNNNMSMDFKENSIDNIMNAISIQESDNDLAEVIFFRLLQMWCFDLSIMESDRNSTNWSIIKSISGNVFLAPIYDCSTMCMMNNDVFSLYSNLRSDYQVYNIIDSIQYSLKINNNSSNNLYEDFGFLCDAFPNEVLDILQCLFNINVYKAIDDINNRISNEMNGSFEIPYFIGSWINRVIKIRLETLRSIFENSKRKRLI